MRAAAGISTTALALALAGAARSEGPFRLEDAFVSPKAREVARLFAREGRPEEGAAVRRKAGLLLLVRDDGDGDADPDGESVPDGGGDGAADAAALLLVVQGDGDAGPDGDSLPDGGGDGDPGAPDLDEDEDEGEDGDLVGEVVLDRGETSVTLSFGSITGGVGPAFPVARSDDRAAFVWRSLNIGRAIGKFRVEGGLLAIDFYHLHGHEEAVGGVYGGMGVSGGVYRNFGDTRRGRSFYLGNRVAAVKVGDGWGTTVQAQTGVILALNDSVFARLGTFLTTDARRLHWTWGNQSSVNVLVGKPSVLGGPTQFKVSLGATWVRDLVLDASFPRYLFSLSLNRQGKFRLLPW